jgi:hypothetical protein
MDNSSYCLICSTCGEEGCCSPLNCKQSPDGAYCDKYLKDLKFGYKMFEKIYPLIEKDPKYTDFIDKIFDEIYDETY